MQSHELHFPRTCNLCRHAELTRLHDVGGSNAARTMFNPGRSSRGIKKLPPRRASQDFSSQDAAVITIPLTYSANTTNANLKMTNQPGYTFANAYNGCSDGYFPIDGMLLGNSYRASPVALLTRAASGTA